MFSLPGYVWALVLAGALGIPIATAVMLHRGALAAGLEPRTASRVATTTIAVALAWLTLSAALALAGAYRTDADQLVPWLLVLVAVGLAGMLVVSRTATMRRILTAPDAAARLALPHTLRVLGVLFLIVMAQGHLPAAFALPAGLGDIAIGLTAPFVYRRLAAGVGRAAAIRFNLLGTLDLLLAGLLAYLLAGPIAVSPTTEALRLLPLALIPTVAVPLAIALHLVSLAQLRSPGTPPTTTTASARTGSKETR
jgi:hypothetical protein